MKTLKEPNDMKNPINLTQLVLFGLSYELIWVGLS